MGRSNASRPPSRQVIQSNARIAELEAENARLLEQQRASADQSGGEVAQLNNRIAELEAAVDKAKLEIQERVAEKVELQEAVRKAEGNASLSTLREDNLRHGISTIGCKREIDAACSGVIKGKLYRSINRLCLNIPAR